MNELDQLERDLDKLEREIKTTSEGLKNCKKNLQTINANCAKNANKSGQLITLKTASLIADFSPQYIHRIAGSKIPLIKIDGIKFTTKTGIEKLLSTNSQKDNT